MRSVTYSVLFSVCSPLFFRLLCIYSFIFIRYGEVCLYNFENPDIAFNGTSHFTQLVWNDTSDLGFGVAQKKFDGNYCLFAAARYRPQGNINDKEAFKRNIKKGKFDPFVNNCVVSSQADDTHM